jgi:hypothetical protein
MDHNNNPQDEAPEQFEFELTDEQLEAVAGGADPRQFFRNVDQAGIEANPTLPSSPDVLKPNRPSILRTNK